MKLTRNIFLVILLAIIPVSSYAFVELGGYGGYSTGTYDDLKNNTSFDSKGPQYGAYAHLTAGLGNVYLGFGIFYHGSSLTLSNSGFEADMDVTSMGAEAVLSLGFPMVPVSPYVRIGISALDKFKGASETTSRVLASYHAGIGLAYKIVPLVSIFGEYFHQQLNTIHSDSEFEIVNHGANLGLRLNL